MGAKEEILETFTVEVRLLVKAYDASAALDAVRIRLNEWADETRAGTQEVGALIFHSEKALTKLG